MRGIGKNLQIYMHKYIHTNIYTHMNTCMCHKGVVFQTIKSFVHAMGIYLQMTEATNK